MIGEAMTNTGGFTWTAIGFTGMTTERQGLMLGASNPSYGPQTDSRDAAVGIIGHLFVVAARGSAGRGWVWIQGFQFAVVAVVLVIGQVVAGVLDGERQAVVAVGVGRIIPRNVTAAFWMLCTLLSRL